MESKRTSAGAWFRHVVVSSTPLVIAALAMMNPAASFAQTLRGVVFDSLVTHRPLAGAEVWSPTLNRSAVADSNGRFAFEGLNRGTGDTLELAVYHTTLDRMAIPTSRIKVPVAALGGEPIVVGVPSAPTLRRLICGAAADSAAVLAIGRLSGVPADGGTIRLAAYWEELVATGTTLERRARTAPAELRGQTYWVCGAPLATSFALVAQGGDGPATVVRVGATQEPVVVRHLITATLADSMPGSAGERWTVTGRAVSRVGDALSGAEVTVSGRTARARTTPDGRFAVSLVGSGRYEITVRAVGYEPAVLSVYLAPRQRDLPEIVLERTIQVLAERTIAASRSGLRGFEYRRRTGQGYYMDRSEIERRKPLTTSQLFMGIPSVWVQQSGTVAFRRSEGQVGLKFPGGCLPLYFIDGVPREIAMPLFPGIVPPDLGPNQFVVPSEIEAIEVYKGLGSIPVEFKKLDAGCGVIVIWTRRGLDATDQAAPPR